MQDYTVSPWIPVGPKLAVVGQGPGTDEWRRGRPFIGREGQLLRGWLTGFGLDPDEDVMYSNVHDRYHPEAPAYVPSTKECKEGYARLAGEFGLVPSLRCVVLLGGPAAHMVFKGRMGEMHGRQGSIGVESAAAETGAPTGSNLAVTGSGGQRTATPPAKAASPSAAAPSTPTAVGGGVLVSPPGKPARDLGRDGGSTPPTSTIPVLACFHPGFFWHSKGAKARAAAENEILSVLGQAVDIVNGKSTEVELPVPEYVEEVTVV